MVLMNFAATRGPKQLWPGYIMRNIDPAVTLHDAARLVLKDDAEDGYETLNEEEKDGEGSEDEDGDEEEDSSEDEEDEEMEEGNDSN